MQQVNCAETVLGNMEACVDSERTAAKKGPWDCADSSW